MHFFVPLQSHVPVAYCVYLFWVVCPNQSLEFIVSSLHFPAHLISPPLISERCNSISFDASMCLVPIKKNKKTKNNVTVRLLIWVLCRCWCLFINFLSIYPVCHTLNCRKWIVMSLNLSICLLLPLHCFYNFPTISPVHTGRIIVIYFSLYYYEILEQWLLYVMHLYRSGRNYGNYQYKPVCYMNYK